MPDNKKEGLKQARLWNCWDKNICDAIILKFWEAGLESRYWCRSNIRGTKRNKLSACEEFYVECKSFDGDVRTVIQGN